MLLAVAAGVWSIMRDESSVLIITSNPIGAEVVLNYRPVGIRSNAILCGLPADSFVVSLRMDGHRPVPPEHGVRLRPNDTTRVNFFLAPVARGDERELPRATGAPYKWQWRVVRLNSEPPGAEIVIEDQKTGVLTPANILFESGTHHLQAHWPNGAKSYKNVFIDPAQSQPDVIFQPATYQQPETAK
jgi:hypothetical protein